MLFKSYRFQHQWKNQWNRIMFPVWKILKVYYIFYIEYPSGLRQSLSLSKCVTAHQACHNIFRLQQECFCVSSNPLILTISSLDYQKLPPFPLWEDSAIFMEEINGKNDSTLPSSRIDWSREVTDGTSTLKQDSRCSLSKGSFPICMKDFAKNAPREEQVEMHVRSRHVLLRSCCPNSKAKLRLLFTKILISWLHFRIRKKIFMIKEPFYAP